MCQIYEDFPKITNLSRKNKKKERDLIEYHALLIFLVIDVYRFLPILLNLLEDDYH